MKLERYETPDMEVMSFDGENILCASVADDFIIEGDTHLSSQADAVADAAALFQ
ncbi:MAG: hypothetical protein IJT23_02930 [Clostridia bacterium]|nr:hypothetical protein [Clostridia bacterium]